jgi:iron complex transport system permease protein
MAAAARAMAILVGAALGVSGAIFQSLMRNPLGSPDVMGFNTGAWSGVLVAMVLFGQHLTAITFTAMAGGILTSLVIWLLAWRNGIDTFRLIIIGIGVRAMLMAFNTWLLLQASLETALSAGLWYAGSLNGLTWGKTWPAAPLILLMFIGALLLVRRMRLLEMGDDSACALGVSVERSRLMLMLVAVVLTAAATAIAGPISFIALVAPHIARRLSGTARWGLTQAALCGAAAAGGRSLRPAAVYALSTAGGRGNRQPRRYLPHRLVSSGVTQEMTETATACAATT